MFQGKCGTSLHWGRNGINSGGAHLLQGPAKMAGEGAEHAGVIRLAELPMRSKLVRLESRCRVGRAPVLLNPPPLSMTPAHIRHLRKGRMNPGSKVSTRREPYE